MDRVAGRLAAHGIDILRVCLGLVIAGFGMLKFFPGVSPAEPLVTRAVDTLTFGALTGQTAMVATAIAECAIGLALITGRFLRTGLVLLAGCVLGWMSHWCCSLATCSPAAGQPWMRSTSSKTSSWAPLVWW